MEIGTDPEFARSEAVKLAFDSSNMLVPPGIERGSKHEIVVRWVCCRYYLPDIGHALVHEE